MRHLLLAFALCTLLLNAFLIITRPRADALYWLTYSGVVDGRYGIYRTPFPTGGFIQPITTHVANVETLVYANHQLIFTSRHPHTGYDLYRWDHGRIRQLTADPTDEISAVWSPHGIAYIVRERTKASLEPPEFDLYLYDGTRAIPLKTDAADDGFPQWSGDSLVFVSYTERQGNILRLHPATTTLDNLTNNRIFNPHTPAVFGDQVAFFGDNARVLYQQDTTGLHAIVRNMNNGNSLQWSPDGQWLLFIAFGFAPPVAEIYRVHSDGSDLQRLRLPVPNPYLPKWSPDGQWIAFQVFLGNGKTGIGMAHPDGSDYHLLENVTISANSPMAFSPEISRKSLRIWGIIIPLLILFWRKRP